DARLPVRQGGLHLALDLRAGRDGVRLHQELAEAAAEVRAHDPLAGLRVEDDPNRLPHLVGAEGVVELAVRAGIDRERPAAPEVGEDAHTGVSSSSYSTIEIDADVFAAAFGRTDAVTVGASALGVYASSALPAAVAEPSVAVSATSTAAPAAEPAASMSSALWSEKSSAAISPALSETLGGMQNFSRSSAQSWKMKTTIGRKMLSTNVATIVINGIDSEQICAPPSLPLEGTPPPVDGSIFIDEPAGETIFTAAPLPIGSDPACAFSFGMSGSWIVIGWLAVPVRSKCEASW